MWIWLKIFHTYNNEVEMWQYFKELLHNGIQKNILKINGFHHWKKSSWKCSLYEGLRAKNKKKARVWTRFVETRSPCIRREYKKLRNEVRKETRLIAKKEQCEVAKQCRSNPKNRLGSTLIANLDCIRELGFLKTVDDKGCSIVVNKDVDKVNALSKFFASIYTPESNSYFDELVPQKADIAFGNVFTDHNILDKLSKLNINKSPGPNLLHPHILYEVRYKLLTSLRLTFEASYCLGVVSSDWRVAHTVPIYKKGSKAELNNYRPVSLKSVVCKVI